MKTCRICCKEKELQDFYTSKNMKDGFLTECKTCYVERTRRNYKARHSYYLKYHQKRYREDEGWLMLNKYSGIKSRCSGKRKHKYTVSGSKFLSRKSFKKWWEDNRSVFLKLHKQWRESGYNTKLSPSIDRVDNSKGYVPSNMQWLTHSDNSIKYKN